MDIFSYLLGKKSSGGGGGGGSADLDWQAIGFDKRPEAIDYGYEYAKEIQENWVPSTNLANKFRDDKNIKFMPLVDTSTATNMQGMFQNCYSLYNIAKIDTSKVIFMNNIFSSCYALFSIPLLDTKEVTNFGSAFANCFSLKKIPKLNVEKGTDFGSMFTGCSELTTVPVFDIKKIDFPSGLTNMFRNCKKLTDQSLDNILQICIGIETYSGTKTLNILGINDTTVFPVSRIEALPHYQDFLDAGWTIGY